MPRGTLEKQPRFGIAVRWENDVAIVALSGEIDVDAAQPVAAALSRAAAARRTLVIDLVDVTFFDSSGLMVLGRLHRALGNRLELGPVSPQVGRVLEHTAIMEY